MLVAGGAEIGGAGTAQPAALRVHAADGALHTGQLIQPTNHREDMIYFT